MILLLTMLKEARRAELRKRINSFHKYQLISSTIKLFQDITIAILRIPQTLLLILSNSYLSMMILTLLEPFRFLLIILYLQLVITLEISNYTNFNHRNLMKNKKFSTNFKEILKNCFVYKLMIVISLA